MLTPGLPVGTTFRHARHGYRATVVAVHPSCKASPAWLARSSTPFAGASRWYVCLVDARDRADAGVAYVAEDSVAPVVGEADGCVHLLNVDWGAVLAAQEGGGASASTLA